MKHLRYLADPFSIQFDQHMKSIRDHIIDAVFEDPNMLKMFDKLQIKVTFKDELRSDITNVAVNMDLRNPKTGKYLYVI